MESHFDCSLFNESISTMFGDIIIESKKNIREKIRNRQNWVRFKRDSSCGVVRLTCEDF